MITGYFDREKALEVLLYVSSRVPKMYHIQKVIYFANRYHLDEYGRFIVDDKIVAMKYGPVLSSIYDMIKSSRGDSDKFPEAKESLRYTRRRGNTDFDIISPKRDTDLDYLSESDLICLDQAISNLQNLNFDSLCDFSHDSLYNSVPINKEITVDLIVDHSNSPDLLREYLKG